MQVADQGGRTSKQMKLEMPRMAASRTALLTFARFHPPLYAATWGLLREACAVPGGVARGLKEVVRALQ